MRIHQNFESRTYLPAVLKRTKAGYLITYYAYNPYTDSPERVRVKLNRVLKRYKSKKDALIHANELVLHLNKKLSEGWSPFVQIQPDSRQYQKLSVVAELFLEEKTKELRVNSLRSYRSFIKKLLVYAEQTNKYICCSNFNREQAVRFADDFYQKNVTARSYNNLIKAMRVFFNWATEKQYTNVNPFNSIKLKQVRGKKRTIIPAEIRKKITAFLERDDKKGVALLLDLVFFSLIRPNEVRQLKIADIDIEKKCVRVPANVAKNHKERCVALSNRAIKLLNGLKIWTYPQHFFLISKDFTPALKQASTTRYSKTFAEIRKELDIPENMQLYSLRDTGIFEMLKSGIDDLSVMQHADHHSLNITTIYANHHDPELIDKINKNAPEF